MEIITLLVWIGALPMLLSVMHPSSTHGTMVLLNRISDGEQRERKIMRRLRMTSLMMVLSMAVLIFVQFYLLVCDQDLEQNRHAKGRKPSIFSWDPLVYHHSNHSDKQDDYKHDFGAFCKKEYVEYSLLISMSLFVVFMAALFRCAANMMISVQVSITGLFDEIHRAITSHDGKAGFLWAVAEAEYYGRFRLATTLAKEQHLDKFLDTLFMFIFATVAAAGFNVVREDAKVRRSGAESMAFCLLVCNSAIILLAIWTVYSVLNTMIKMHSTGKLVEAAEDLFHQRTMSTLACSGNLDLAENDKNADYWNARTMKDAEKVKADAFIQTLRSRRLTVAHIFGFPINKQTVIKMAATSAAHVTLLIAGLQFLASNMRENSVSHHNNSTSVGN